MPSYNRTLLMGNLTRDVEIRYVGSGTAVAKFTLAVNRHVKGNKETGYYDIVVWDKLAETVNEHLKKGSGAFVDGRLSIRSYDDKEGNKRKATEIVANIVQFLDRAPADGGEAPSAHAEEEYPDDTIPF